MILKQVLVLKLPVALHVPEDFPVWWRVVYGIFGCLVLFLITINRKFNVKMFQFIYTWRVSLWCTYFILSMIWLHIVTLRFRIWFDLSTLSPSGSKFTTLFTKPFWLSDMTEFTLHSLTISRHVATSSSISFFRQRHYSAKGEVRCSRSADTSLK